jgi:hypothetical protein
MAGQRTYEPEAIERRAATVSNTTSPGAVAWRRESSETAGAVRSPEASTRAGETQF